jgi:hypothetical protein
MKLLLCEKSGGDGSFLAIRDVHMDVGVFTDAGIVRLAAVQKRWALAARRARLRDAIKMPRGSCVRRETIRLRPRMGIHPEYPTVVLMAHEYWADVMGSYSETA